MYQDPNKTRPKKASERMEDKRSKYSVSSGKQQAKKALGGIGSKLSVDTAPEEVQLSGAEATSSYRVAYNELRETMTDATPEAEVNGPDLEGPATLSNLGGDMYGKKGSEAGDVAPHSYYNDPVTEKGFTRNAGGAPKEAQEEAIKAIIKVGRSLDASDDEIAYALATARYESGFNKYAAAKSSSAYGLGQFIDKTGQAYGLTQGNRDDIELQAQALVEHVLDNFELARKKGLGVEYVYALHHDGPSLDKGGLGLSKQNIVPFLDKYRKVVENY